jgi:hypothetical protein
VGPATLTGVAEHGGGVEGAAGETVGPRLELGFGRSGA